jgi:hypothetical protein
VAVVSSLTARIRGAPWRYRAALLGAGLVLLAGAASWMLIGEPETEAGPQVTVARKGEFRAVVMTSGEIHAPKFVQIAVPPNGNQAGQNQMKIATLLPEGTIVQAGQVVAELDRSTIAARVADVTLNLHKARAVYEQAALDSTLNLAKAREEIRTMELVLEERQLAKDQARFEAPTVKRQAEIDYEKAVRGLAQARADFITRRAQAQAKLREVGAEQQRLTNLLAIVQTVMDGFTIRAPAGGMMIYAKEWDGRKRTVGSQVSSWDPTIATLPDFSVMESVTHINELDVKRVEVGQSVVISLDSDASKRLTGRVISVANVGEQRPNNDAKVFEVKIGITQLDTTLRPGMTTANQILVAREPDVLFVSSRAVTTDSGVPVVYTRRNRRVTKQEVQTGRRSDDEVVIVRGLNAGDTVLISPPPNHAAMTIARLSPAAVSSPTASQPPALRSEVPPNVTSKP